MEKYIIIAACDPYNARHHYNHETVVKYDGATPVQWIFRDETFDTLEEAKEALLKVACFDYSFYDDEDIADEKEMLKEEIEDPEELDEAFDWYKGPGVYDSDQNHALVMLAGDQSFHDDSMSYWIDTVEE